LFDLSKISFAVPVIGTVVSKESFAFATFWGGMFFTITTFLLAVTHYKELHTPSALRPPLFLEGI